VIYLADQDVNTFFELYSVPINGGPPIQLNSSLIAGGDVMASFQISAHGQRVIYRADQDADDVFELYSVSAMGGQTTRLNADLPFGSDVEFFQLSPDGAFVVYSADQNVFDERELFAHRLTADQPPETDELCVPIKARNGNIALICL